MQANFELLKEIKKRVTASSACVDSLISVPSDSERFRNLLELSLRQQETACIEMRRLYDMVKKPESRMQKPADGNITEVFGKISVTPEGWVHIKLNFLLPHCRMTGATQYVSDSILRLLNSAEFDGIKLPFFNKAYLGIIEFCPLSTTTIRDTRRCRTRLRAGFFLMTTALKCHSDFSPSSGRRAAAISMCCLMMRPEFLPICACQGNWGSAVAL